MYCPQCGTQNDDSARFCIQCGTMLRKSSAPTVVDDRTWVQEALKGEYEIQGEIGRGGMAIIFQGREIALDRIVALKVLPRQLTFDRPFVARFQREARMAARLDHPHIIPIYRVGQIGQVAYFAMKLVNGESLSIRLHREGALPVEDIVRIGMEMCAGLGHAHNRGVIHRDIKPDNILLDREIGAILTDFGIARAASGTQLTAAGMAFGTPHYMSPEQALGQDVDARSDLYSLGILLYELSTGTLPFQAEDPTAVTHAQIYEPPEPPRVRKEGVPEWLEAVILKGLAKSPEDRFESAEELEEALRTQKRVAVPEFQVVSPTSPTPEPMFRRKPKTSRIAEFPTPLEKPLRDVRQRRLSGRMWLLAIGMALGLAIGVLLIVQATQRHEEKPKGMVWIRKGTFQMGSSKGDNDERPVHIVRLNGFWMDKYEVTNQDYRRFDPSHNSGEYRGYSLNADTQPVVLVSWWDAIRYCNWRSRQEGLEPCYDEDTAQCDFAKNGYRLPTEAEWEYAARGGMEGNRYPYGDSLSHSDANYLGTGKRDHWDGASPVGSFPPNGYGSYDMAGNAYEWCYDWYHEDYYSKSPESNPVAVKAASYRVLRGGSWNYEPAHIRCAYRNSSHPMNRYHDVGFRCVRSP